MQLQDAAPTVGIAACLAILALFAAPYVLISDPGSGLTLYYGAGPVGAIAVGFLALLNVVVLLSATRGRAEPDLVAGFALVLGLAILALTVLWAGSVPRHVVLGFPAAWMGNHRWVVVVVAALVPVSAAVYARSVL
jgi:hypothetical protein